MTAAAEPSGAAGGVLSFRTSMPIGETMDFEALYEPQLAMELEEKTALLREPGAIALWMFVGGILAGETYGAPAPRAAPSANDLEVVSVIDCYSTSLLPPFQGRNLAKILKAYWFGMARAAGHTHVAGQATTPAMLAVNLAFGAVVRGTRERYYGTSRTAYEYTLAALAPRHGGRPLVHFPGHVPIRSADVRVQKGRRLHP